MVVGFHHSQEALNLRLLFFVGFFLSPSPLLSDSVKSERYNQIQKRSSQILPELLKEPLVEAQYKKCLEQQIEKNVDMGKCLWDGLKENGKVLVPPLAEKDKERIQNRIKGQAGADVVTTKIGKNPALKKLEEYYGNRLKKIIGSEDGKKNKKIMADHTVYNKIYRSQLGKNVVSALSGYCLDADAGNYLIDKNRINEIRKNNLKMLEEQISVGGQTIIRAYAHWENCALQIQHICHDTCTEPGEDTIKKYCCDDKCRSDSDLFKHSQERACEVVDYIQAVRQNLLVLDKIDKKWEKRTATGFAGNLVHDVKIDEITNLSSKEIVERSGYSQEQQKLIEEMDECAKNFVPQKCQKFVRSRTKEDAALLDEYSLRTKIIQDKIDKIKNSKKKEDSLMSYLKEEGYSEEQIVEMLQEEDTDKLQERIARRFREKRKALQQSLKDRFNRTRTGENDSSIEKIKIIQQDAANERQRLGELVFFTNMISGFLKIGDEKGNILGTNSEALQQELGDSVFSSEDGSPSIDFKAIKKVGKEASVPFSKKNIGESRNLNVETINEALLNYN